MAWYEELYASVDALDMDTAAEHFAEDVVLTMGNLPQIVGRAAVVGALKDLQSGLAGLRHTFATVAVDDVGAVTMLEARVRFELRDGTVVDIPSVTVLERRGELVVELRMYSDMAPLAAAAQAGETAATPAGDRR